MISIFSVVANAFPANYSEMVRLGLKHKFTEARKLHYDLIDITDALFADGNPGGIKYALHLLKKCETYVRLPLCEPNDKVKHTLTQLIKQYK